MAFDWAIESFVATIENQANDVEGDINRPDKLSMLDVVSGSHASDE